MVIIIIGLGMYKDRQGAMGFRILFKFNENENHLNSIEVEIKTVDSYVAQYAESHNRVVCGVVPLR